MPLSTSVGFAGSKWTALERTFGWRHFHVQQKQNTGKDVFVLMQSTCDRTTQFWVRAALHLQALCSLPPCCTNLQPDI